jgi:uncharacterized protein YecE (DUF72 family)
VRGQSGPGLSAQAGGNPPAHPQGTLYAGTSGFSYPDWSPRFYPPRTPAGKRLAYYASHLSTVELNATFRRRPTESAIAGWMAATPSAFRFVVKAQRGSALRALLQSPEESIGWLTEPLPHFGDRLGAVLFRIPAEIRRGGPIFGGDVAESDRRLAALLSAWPASIPLVMEFQDASWHVDETFAALTKSDATLCATDQEGDEAAPTIRRTGDRLYLRLRREAYTDADVETWAGRLEPFLESGLDAYVFFRHDADGRAAELAEALARRVEARRRS